MTTIFILVFPKTATLTRSFRPDLRLFSLKRASWGVAEYSLIRVFPTAKHLVSWAGCCPRNDQSSGKVKSTRISRAGVYLKPILLQVANAVIKSDKYPECKQRYRRLKARRGHKKAIIAICRMLLTAIWNILSKVVPYSAAGYIADKLTEHSVVITKAQGLELLRKKATSSKMIVPLTLADSCLNPFFEPLSGGFGCYTLFSGWLADCSVSNFSFQDFSTHKWHYPVYQKQG